MQESEVCVDDFLGFLGKFFGDLDFGEREIAVVDGADKPEGPDVFAVPGVSDDLFGLFFKGDEVELSFSVFEVFDGVVKFLADIFVI